MAKQTVTYKAGEGDPRSVEWRGRRFHHNVPVELDDEKAADKELIEAAKGNVSFNVGDQDKAAEAAAASEARGKADAQAELAALDDEMSEMQKRHEEEKAALEAKQTAEVEAFKAKNAKRAEALHEMAGGSQAPAKEQPPQNDPGNPNQPQSPPPNPNPQPPQQQPTG